MNKSPINSRNKIVQNSNYTICPKCRERVYYSSLHSSNGDIEYFSKNTIIITCNHCNEEFVPDVTRCFDYKYNNKCRRKDGKNGN